LRVLAFEDHYEIKAMLIAGDINVDGWVIEQRWDSSEALDHIQRFNPDVLLLDHYMPPMSGFEVLDSLLKSTGPRPNIVVAISSDPRKNDDMRRLGADISIVKFDLSTLDIWR